MVTLGKGFRVKHRTKFEKLWAEAKGAVGLAVEKTFASVEVISHADLGH